MKVLFIGGTGVLSSACSELAISKGIDLFHLNRGISAEIRNIKGVKKIIADIRDVENTRKALEDDNALPFQNNKEYHQNEDHNYLDEEEEILIEEEMEEENNNFEELMKKSLFEIPNINDLKKPT